MNKLKNGNSLRYSVESLKRNISSNYPTKIYYINEEISTVTMDFDLELPIYNDYMRLRIRTVGDLINFSQLPKEQSTTMILTTSNNANNTDFNVEYANKLYHLTQFIVSKIRLG